MSDYTINFTDPLRSTYLIRPYTSDGNRFPTTSVRAPTATAANSVLLLHGKGHPDYGERTNENLLHLAENFSGASAPIITGDGASGTTLTGLLWHREKLFHYDNTSGATAFNGLYRWTFSTIGGSPSGSWSPPFSPDYTGTTTPVGPNDGETWFDGTVLRQYSADTREINQWIVREYSESGAAPVDPPQRDLVINHEGDATDWSVVLEEASASALFLRLDNSGTPQTVLDAVTFDDDITITGFATVGTTLDVGGNTTVGGTLEIGSGSPYAITLQPTGDSAFSGNMDVGGTLDVIGDTTLDGNLTLTDGKVVITDMNADCDDFSLTVINNGVGNSGPVLYLKDDILGTTAPALLMQNLDIATWSWGIFALRDNGWRFDRGRTETACSPNVAGGSPPFVESVAEVRIDDGRVRTLVSDYELLIAADDDALTNKKYVDDEIAAAVLGAIGADTFLVSGTFAGGILTLSYNAGSPASFDVTGIIAGAIPFTPGGDLVATNVQAALTELDTEKAAVAGDTFTGPVVFSSSVTSTSTASFVGAAGTVTVPLLTGVEPAASAVNKGYVDTLVSGLSGLTATVRRDLFSPPAAGSPAVPYTHVLPFEYTAGTNRLFVFRNGVKLYNSVYGYQDVDFDQSITIATATNELPAYQVLEYSGSPAGFILSGVHTSDFTVGDTVRVDNAVGVPVQTDYTVSGAPSVVGSPANTFVPVTPAGPTPTAGPQNPATVLGINYNFSLNLDGGGATVVGTASGSPSDQQINGIDVNNFSDLITNINNALDLAFGADSAVSYIFNGNVRFQSLNTAPSSGSVVLGAGTTVTSNLFAVGNLGSNPDFNGFSAPVSGTEYGYIEVLDGSPQVPAAFEDTTSTILFTVPALLPTDVIEVLAT